MSVAYGEVEADGDVVVLHIFVEHRVHIVEAVLWVFVFVELSHDNASNVRDKSSHLHIVEHTIHLTHALACILHKEDDVWQQQRIEVRTSEIIVDREVASHDDAFSPTLDIQWMRRNTIGWQIALKHATNPRGTGPAG